MGPRQSGLDGDGPRGVVAEVRWICLWLNRLCVGFNSLKHCELV